MNKIFGLLAKFKAWRNRCKPQIENVDPCSYEVAEIHHNATVEVLRCKKCGKVRVIFRKGKGDVL